MLRADSAAAGGWLSVAESFAALGKPVLAADQQVIVAGTEVISGEIGYDGSGLPVVARSGTWKLLDNGTVRDLETSSLHEAYEKLNLTALPPAPAPSEPVAFGGRQAGRAGQSAGVALGPGGQPGAAGAEELALAFLSGDPAADLTAVQLRQVAQALAGRRRGALGLALGVLGSVADRVLGELFADGRLAEVLAGGVLPGDPAGLAQFFAWRFGVGPEQVARGGAAPLEVYQDREFSPGLVDPALIGLRAGDGLTREQARAALWNRGDMVLMSALNGLPPVQAARARWWLRAARETAGWADQALAFLAGDPAVRLDADGQRELVVALMTGLASTDERWLALQVLGAASDAELRDIAGAGDELAEVLEAGIPVGHSLRPELEVILAQRFRMGWAARDYVRAGQSAGVFSPALLDGSLDGLALDGVLDGAALGRVRAAVEDLVSRLGLGELTGRLSGLPAVQRARAARWLTAVRIALNAQGTATPQVMAAVDELLDGLYRAAAASVPGPGGLRLVTARPSAEQEAELRQALDPAPVLGSGNGHAEPFASILPGQDQDFGDRLREAYRRDIDGYTQRDGRWPQGRGPGGTGQPAPDGAHRADRA